MKRDIKKFIADLKENVENHRDYRPTESDIEMLEDVLEALEEAKYQAEHQCDYSLNMIAEKVNKILKD
ncbi:hypothetical protein ACIQZG_08425 [Lysinibacillus sp. NPDC096418]|uniref:hypothetical protein n=1 Tax=Lysinibacillus sp. NPDC096418 TaxID=3364138 RepID=UPI00382FB301